MAPHRSPAIPPHFPLNSLGDCGGTLNHPHETQYDVNATSPVFHDGQIFITSGYGSGSEMVKLLIDGKKASVETVWRSKELDNHHGGVILLDGYLYGAAHQRNGGRWICLAWNDGTKKYAEKGVGKGSLTCADGMLYCWSENGQVGLVPATIFEPRNRFDSLSATLAAWQARETAEPCKFSQADPAGCF